MTDVSPKRRNTSAGLLLFKRTAGGLRLFLAHPGGPFWRKHDDHAWTIPKGLVEPGEEPFNAAQREFHEETGITPTGPFIPLGAVRQRSGKTVHAWAWEGDADPSAITSNEGRTEWPRGSGRWITYRRSIGAAGSIPRRRGDGSSSRRRSSSTVSRSSSDRTWWTEAA